MNFVNEMNANKDILGNTPAATEIDEDGFDPGSLDLEDPAPVDDNPGKLSRKLRFDSEALDSSPPGTFVKQFLAPPRESEPAPFVDVFEDFQPETTPLESEEVAVPVEEMMDTMLDDEIDKGTAAPTPEPVVENTEPVEKKYKTSETHRSNSSNWHKKWVSAGVPRASNASSSSTASSETTKVTLTQAKDKFIAEWIKSSNLPPSNERRSLAIKAWMDSSARAEYLAGRAGVQK